jgi:hypothetical protein
MRVRDRAGCGVADPARRLSWCGRISRLCCSEVPTVAAPEAVGGIVEHGESEMSAIPSRIGVDAHRIP